MAATERELRIFVSSTFADMRLEREALATIAIPALEDFATSQGVHLDLVDLRWGLETGGAIDDALILACLHAVDSCRPFFLGIVGSRRGTVVSGIGEGVAREHGWVREQDEWSITEIEMEYGALRYANGESLFYLKADDGDDSDVGRLKDRIRESGLPVFDGYRTIDELVDRFVADVKGIVIRVAGDAGFPEQESRAVGRVMLPARLPADVVPLPDRLAQLRQAIESGHQRVAIVGPSGCGKTSLVSAWAVERAAADGVLLSYSDAANHITPWQDIVETLVVRAAGLEIIDAELARESEKRAILLEELTAALPPGLDVTIVIDPVDRIALPGGIAWLPADLPPNVRLLVTAKSNPPATTPMELERAGFHSVELDWLSETDQSALLTGLVANRGRLLRKSARDRVLGSRASSSPSFLSAAATYLSGHASHEDLDRHASQLESLTSPAEIVSLDLERLADLVPYGRIVRASFAAASRVRHGVRDADLRDVVVRLHPSAAGAWTAVRRAILRYVRERRDGFLVPRPDALDAILATCSGEEAMAAEEALLDVLRSAITTVDPFPGDYLEFVMSRLAMAQRTDQAVALLCSRPLCEIDREWWLSSGRHLFIDLENLVDLLPRTFETADLASRVADLQFRLRLHEDALKTKRAAIDLYEKSGDRNGAALARSQMATWVLNDDPSSELEAHVEARGVLIDSGPARATADVMIAVSKTLTRLGRFTEALVELETAERVDAHPSVAARCAVQIARIHLELGFAEDAVAIAHNAVLLAGRSGSYDAACEAHRCRAEIKALFEDVDGAVLDFRSAAGMAMAAGNISMMMTVMDRLKELDPGKSVKPVDLESDVLEIEREILGPGTNRRWGETF